jgi:hypothetical protein
MMPSAIPRVLQRFDEKAHNIYMTVGVTGAK